MENKNTPQQIFLELPDYSYDYKKWLESQKQNENESTVIIIDLY